MKTLFFIVIIMFIISCDYNPSKQNKSIYANAQYFYETADRRVYVYLIDSCEYIGNLNSIGDDLLTHKGNCKFCKERNKGK